MVYDKNKFKSVSQIIASYDFFDLATNIAFKNFFASINSTNSLSPHQQDTNKVKTTRTTDGTTEINFDYQFNLNMVVSGDFIIAYTIATGSGSTTGTMNIDWRIIHVDSSNNETELVATISGDTLPSVDGAPRSSRQVISGSISRTPFKIGEKIRVEAKLIADTGSGNAFADLYHDPTSRVSPPGDIIGGTPKADLTFVIPFEVQP